jgi:hypothetical protein
MTLGINFKWSAYGELNLWLFFCYKVVKEKMQISSILATLFRSLVLCSQMLLNYLAFEYTWWRLFYLMKVILPDEGYSTRWRLFYLMKVILPDEGYSTWWRLFYQMKVILPDEGYSTWWRLFYLMKVILPDEGYSTRWRLFQKHVVHTKFDIYFCFSFRYKIKLIKHSK